MAKKVAGFIKLQIPAGQANPAPPVGPALGQHGVNIMEFCKAFNARTQNDNGTGVNWEDATRFSTEELMSYKITRPFNYRCNFNLAFSLDVGVL